MSISQAIGINADGFAITEKESREEGLSLFSDVLKRKAYNRDPVLNIKGNEPSIKILSGTPQDALLIPIEIRDRVIALLYFDNGTTSVLNANVGYLSKLATMAGIACEIIILRKRTLEM